MKPNVNISDIYEIMNPDSFYDFGVGYESMVVRRNGAFIDVCKLNLDNFSRNNFVKYFYVDYSDGFGDRIVEKEIEKIATRVMYDKALVIYEKDKEAIRDWEDDKYIDENMTEYKKWLLRNPNSGNHKQDFLQYKRTCLVKRLVRSLKNEVDILIDDDLE